MSRSPFNLKSQSRLFALTAALFSLACGSDPAAPSLARAATDVGRDIVTVQALPHFIDAAAGAPAIANPVVSFYAKVGADRQAFMYYQSQGSVKDSTVFVRFRVRKRSLALRPDGTPFAPGDSILITMTLVDPVHLTVDFQPAGLVFSTRDPANLKMSYAEADGDLNHDGVIDLKDARLQKKLAVWKQEHSTDPWIKQTSIVDVGIHEVESNVFGFTSYLIAW